MFRGPNKKLLVKAVALDHVSGPKNGFGMYGRVCAVSLLAMTISMVPPSLKTSHAQEAIIGSEFQNSKSPMLVQADELVFDNKANAVRAEGNVEIYYNKYTLVAEKVVYDKGRNVLIAEGNVRIKEPDGAIVNADKIELTDDFKEGFISSLRIVTADDARIAAASATRVDGETTIFDRGVFTPCKVCEDDPTKAPVWQVKAMKVIHNKTEKTIEYENATFEFLGVPVAYLPYFSHPDPTVKRKTGFLAPVTGYSDELGFILETPYHVALAENYDITFRPVALTNKGALLKTNWRHRLANGSYTVNLSGVYQSIKVDDGNPNVTSAEEKDFRGSIDTTGKFSLGSFWDFGWDATIESDDEFRRFYKIDNIRQTDRVSKAYLRGQSERSYIEATLFHFGGLVIDDDSSAQSTAQPIVDYNYVFNDPVLGGELSFDANALSLRRDSGTEVDRALINVKWRRQFIDSLGQVFTPFAQARGDIYKATQVTDASTLTGTGTPTNLITEDSQEYTRGQLVAGAEYRLPLVSHTAGASHILEPIAQIITRRTHGENRQNNKTNEDAQSLVFDDTLLFDIDKFSGYDRLETGTRANVGFQYTMQLNSGGYARAVIGQSYHLEGKNAFVDSPLTKVASVNETVTTNGVDIKKVHDTYRTPDNGLQTDQSDFVTGLYLEPNANFSLLGQARFDQDDLSVRRIDLAGNFKYGPLKLRANYIKENTERLEYKVGTSTNLATNTVTSLNKTSMAEVTTEEIIAGGSIQLAENWSVLGGIRYNLEDEFTLSQSLGLQYADECFLFAVNYAETFTDDDDIDPDQSILFKFELKHLGGFSVGSNQVSDTLGLEDDKSTN